MKTDTTEKGLETLIIGGMTAQGLWIAGHPTDYDPRVRDASPPTEGIR